MKKFISILVSVTMILSALCLLGVQVSAEGGYTVAISEQIAVELGSDSSTDTPVTVNGASVAADAAIVSTCSYLLKVTPVNGAEVKEYTLIVNGQEKSKFISNTYNAGSSQATLFITLTEGHYDEVIARGIDTEGNTYDVLKFTDLTVTAPIHEVSEEGIPVEYSPVWTVLPSEMVKSASRMTVTDEGAYAHMACDSTGDPNYYFIQGSHTKIGRFLLIKYDNHSIVPRMQIYMAQDAGVKSDTNMIEFEIAANHSGWTYVMVDMSKNNFYDKDTQEVSYFRFDPLEARNINGGKYKFDGSESIDIAYVMGFTTKEGLTGWLQTNELHEVTKTATLREEQVTKNGDAFTYTDKLGDVYPVTANGDGTYSYTFTAQDVRTPCDTTPAYLMDGSKLIGDGYHVCEAVKDDKTGVVTLTATDSDPYYMLFNEAKTVARYMAVKYRTTVDDQMEFFTSSDGQGPEGGKSFQAKLNADGQWHTAVIDLSSYAFIDSGTYTVNFMRYDFLCGVSEGSVDVEFIAFFNSEDAAYLYIHEYKTYTVTFTASNQVVAKVVFEPGTTSVKEPPVPEKEGYTGAWAAYTMADKNFTVKAVYTEIEQPTEASTEAPTEAPTELQTDADTEIITEADTETVTESATGGTYGEETDAATGAQTDASSDSGCQSALSCAVILFATLAAAVIIKKKR